MMATRQAPCLPWYVTILVFLATVGTVHYISVAYHGVILVKSSQQRTTKKAQQLTNASLHREQQLQLLVNGNASIASDILRIWHVPEHFSIVVELKTNGNCPDPFLRGRLSGPALSIMKWHTPNLNFTQSTHQITGHYRVPHPGIYFVEILAVFCARHFINDTVCVQDYQRLCITSPNATIQVAHAATADSLVPNKDGWNNMTISAITPIVKKTSTLAANNHFWLVRPDAQSIAPLETRMQPPFCSAKSENASTLVCQQYTDVTRFETYTFDWPAQASVAAQLQSVTTLQQPLCFLGRSHSREMRNHLVGIVPHMEWIDRVYPYHVDPTTIYQMKHRKHCDKMVIAMGQWPASFNPPGLTTPANFEIQMQELLMRLNQTFAPSSLFLRSIHYAPLNFRTLACPPQDWRNPQVIEAYNRALRRLAVKFGVRYIDTNDIIGPVWDSSSDWNHFLGEAGKIEATYVAGTVYGLV